MLFKKKPLRANEILLKDNCYWESKASKLAEWEVESLI